MEVERAKRAGGIVARLKTGNCRVPSGGDCFCNWETEKRFTILIATSAQVVRGDDEESEEGKWRVDGAHTRSGVRHTHPPFLRHTSNDMDTAPAAVTRPGEEQVFWGVHVGAWGEARLWPPAL